MSDHKKVRTLPWNWHPLEFMVAGPASPDKTALMAEISNQLLQGQGLHIGVTDAKPANLPRLEFLDLDAVLIDGNGHPTVPGVQMLEPSTALAHTSQWPENPPLAYILSGNHPPGSLADDAVYYGRDKIPQIAAIIIDHWQKSISSRPLKGLILTGGLSTRMGHDKATLVYHGESQSTWAFKLLHTVCDEVFISCRAEQSETAGRLGLPQIHDRHLEMGPMGGILSAMESDQGAAWLVCACDLPLVDKESLKTLIANRNPWRYATAFSGSDGFPEPLFSIYEPKSRARMYQFLAMGYDCPRKMLINSNIQTIKPTSPDMLTNINTSLELAAGQKRWEAQ